MWQTFLRFAKRKANMQNQKLTGKDTASGMLISFQFNIFQNF